MNGNDSPRSPQPNAWSRFSARFNGRRSTGGSPENGAWQRWSNRFAVLLVVATFGVSLIHVVFRERKTGANGTQVLTLAHWQLEDGIRTGFDEMARRYNALRVARGEDEIEFRQIPITEKGYGQWVTTQLMGGTAPDLIELNLGTLDTSVWIRYQARYFVPLTAEVSRPNPYNPDALQLEDKSCLLGTLEFDPNATIIFEAGGVKREVALGRINKLVRGTPRGDLLTEDGKTIAGRVVSDGEHPVTIRCADTEPLTVPLDRVTLFQRAIPWRETYADAMGNPVWELQDYYGVGLSIHSVRFYYNKDLLWSLTSKLADEKKIPAPMRVPPDEYHAFIRLCDLISSMNDEQGRAYVPMAGSQYSFERLYTSMVEPLTAGLMDDVDVNLDAGVTNDETFIAFNTRLRLDDPRIGKVMDVSRELARRLQTGWKGLNRDDAVMYFVQRRAVFIATGSWDCASLKRQAESSARPFEVGVSQFPMVSPEDPKLGDLVVELADLDANYKGPRKAVRPYENAATSCSFGLTKTSKNQELALDFMRFVTSQRANEDFNRHVGWMPAIRGARPAEYLEPFRPNIDGVKPALNLKVGAKSSIVVNQLNPLHQLGEDENGKPFGFKEWSLRMRREWLPAAMQDFQQMEENERDRVRGKELVLSTLRARMLMAEDGPQRERAEQRYFGFIGTPMDGPRLINFWQKRLWILREKGVSP